MRGVATVRRTVGPGAAEGECQRCDRPAFAALQRCAELGAVESVPRKVARLAAAVMVLLLSAHSSTALAADDEAEPSVTPYRPTVSDPATLSAPGWLEGEFGGLRSWNQDHSRDDSVPYLLKYAFDENYGLLLGGNAYQKSQAPDGSAQSGFGDTMLEWKQRFPVDEHLAFGIEAGVIAPTAGHDLGVGKPAWVVNGILSADLSAVHVDVNVAGEHMTSHPAGVSSLQSTWAAAASTALAEKWGTAFELSGTYQRGVATQSQALLAFTYNVSNRLVLDAGGIYGLAHEAHDRSLFAGATVLIGRLH